MAWSNAPLIVYHGTDAASAERIAPKGGTTGRAHAIDLSYCSPEADFGRGFYTTTNRLQAASWANECARAAGYPAALIGFAVDRIELGRLTHLAFVRPSADFHEIVQYCRGGGAAHGRADGRIYDVIHGPVRLWPQRAGVADYDQISFHTVPAIASLRVISMILLRPRVL